jgi:site-specific recombinase XerD
MNGAAQNELAVTLARFVDWARQQGWRYQMAPVHLRHLGRFLRRQGVQELGDVDGALLREYQQELSVLRSAATVQGYLSTLRALWRYLLKEELALEDATRSLSPLRSDYFIPQLYGAQELRRLERASQAAIAQLRGPWLRLNRRAQHAAFGLLRDCGLRVSEACRLNVNDYDSGARTLYIERTKFFKTRHIPLPRSTCTLIEQYLEHRHRLVGDSGESPALFVSMRGRRLGRGSLEARFKQLLCELGLYRPRRRQGRTVFGSTNLHALRHSFAVCTLERWQRQRRDVEALLPLLSGYLGHAKVSYTTHYLHLTPILRQLASERFAQMALPRLDHSGTLDDDE